MMVGRSKCEGIHRHSHSWVVDERIHDPAMAGPTPHGGKTNVDEGLT
jgi:hypothetical protein